MTAKTENRGGKRAGAGAKPKDPALKRKTVSINLSPLARARLDELANADGISKSDWVEQLIMAAASRP